MSKRRILIAPLDWGLGHATRCVPLIQQLQEEGHELILTANGRAEYFLKQSFPELQFVSSPEYSIRYSRYFPMWLMMLIQSPSLLYNFYKENKWLDKFIAENKIDQIISDNRYGLWSKKIKSIFITHQVMIKCPSSLRFMESPLHRIVKWFMNKYSECWIPDVAGENNLSGDLSHRYSLPENAKYIGWLSRFTKPANPEEILQQTEKAKYSICFLLSGPEPQRTELENKILSIENFLPKNCILIQGKTEIIAEEKSGNNLFITSHLAQEELRKIILDADLIVCRSGYSSIMDLEILGKDALLIPTPGQSEQEYLADYSQEKGRFSKMSQEEFSRSFVSFLKHREISLQQKTIPQDKSLAGSKNNLRSSDRVALVE